jgi:hypothetical protein
MRGVSEKYTRGGLDGCGGDGRIIFSKKEAGVTGGVRDFCGRARDFSMTLWPRASMHINPGRPLAPTLPPLPSLTLPALPH